MMHLRFTPLWAYLVATSVLLAAAFTWYYQYNPSIIPSADAWGYTFHAFRWRENYILSDFGGLRTYGYPAFLYFVSFISGLNPQRLALAVAVVQYLLFLAAVGLLVREVNKYNQRLAIAIFAGLALNPVALSAVTDVLTEGLSLTAFVCLTYVSLITWGARRGRGLSVLCGCLIVSIAMMIRPGNVVLLIAWYSSLALCIATEIRSGKTGSGYALAIYAVLGGLVSTSVAFAPQLYYNLQNFNDLSFMPACELGDFQLYTSIFMWKYDTIVMPAGNAAGLIYLNPLISGNISAEAPIYWYLQNPIAGTSTLFAHIFNLFNVTTLFTYVREIHPWYELLLRTLYSSVFLFGLWTTIRSTKQLLQSAITTNIGSVSFVALCCFGLVALGSVTAVEQRFGLIPLATVSVLAIYGATVFRRNRISPIAALGFVAAVGAWLTVGFYMDSLSRSDFGGHAFEFTFSDRCDFTIDGKGWDELYAIFDEMTGK